MISGSIPVWLIRVNSIVYAKSLTECQVSGVLFALALEFNQHLTNFFKFASFDQ